MALVPPVKTGDWPSVRRAIAKLASLSLGPDAQPTFAELTITGLTASRLVATDANEQLVSVSNLASWIAGTTNQITVTDDSDGTVTLSTPQDIHTGASPAFAALTIGTDLLIDGNSIDFTGAGGLGITSTGTFTFKATSTIAISTNGDENDYILLSTSADVPRIHAQGGCNLKISASGGTIDFDDDNVVTSGYGGFGDIQIGVGTNDNEIKWSAEDTKIWEDSDILYLLGEDSINLEAGDGYILLNSSNQIKFQTHGDTDDYIEIGTLSNVPYIQTVGGCNLKITADGGTIDFDNEHLVTTGSLTLPNTGLHLLDTNASHDLIIAPGSDLTADRTLTLTTGDAARTITLSGNPTIADWFNQNVKTTATPAFNGLTSTGNIVAIGNIITNAPNTYDIGDSTNYFKNIYAESVIINAGFTKLGDAITGFQFEPGGYYFQAGGVTLLRMNTTVGHVGPTVYFNKDHAADIDFLVSTANITNFINVDAGNDTMIVGDGGVTNYLEISGTGDLVFAGSGGLPFAEIYAHSASAGITSVNQNDWDQITAFDTDGPSNNATPDHTNDHITITKAGYYLVEWSWSGSGPAAVHDWDFHIVKNNNTVDFSNTSAHHATPSAQNLTSVGGGGIIDCAVNDTIELWVQRLSAGNNIPLTTENCNIRLIQLGGT